MGSKPLHLGGFMNFTPGEWDHPFSVVVSEAYGESAAGAG